MENKQKRFIYFPSLSAGGTAEAFKKKRNYENNQNNINDINTQRRKISSSIDAYNELITELCDTKEGKSHLTKEQKRN